MKKQLLAFLITTCLFTSLISAQPAWFKNPPKDDLFYYYAGIGSAVTLKDAKNSAMNDILSQITFMIDTSISIKASSENKTQESPSSSEQILTFQKRVETESEAIIKDVETVEQFFIKDIENGKIKYTFFLLSRIPKAEIQEAKYRVQNKIDRKSKNNFYVGLSVDLAKRTLNLNQDYLSPVNRVQNASSDNSYGFILSYKREIDDYISALIRFNYFTSTESSVYRDTLNTSFIQIRNLTQYDFLLGIDLSTNFHFLKTGLSLQGGFNYSIPKYSQYNFMINLTNSTKDFYGYKILPALFLEANNFRLELGYSLGKSTSSNNDSIKWNGFIFNFLFKVINF